MLPTYRLHHSPKGGLFQPIIEQTLTLLSSASSEDQIARSNLTVPSKPTEPRAPRTPAWLHIFPEGRVFQHPALQMRYFRWGISRFILDLHEADRGMVRHGDSSIIQTMGSDIGRLRFRSSRSLELTEWSVSSNPSRHTTSK